MDTLVLPMEQDISLKANKKPRTSSGFEIKSLLTTTTEAPNKEGKRPTTVHSAPSSPDTSNPSTPQLNQPNTPYSSNERSIIYYKPLYATASSVESVVPYYRQPDGFYYPRPTTDPHDFHYHHHSHPHMYFPQIPSMEVMLNRKNDDRYRDSNLGFVPSNYSQQETSINVDKTENSERSVQTTCDACKSCIETPFTHDGKHYCERDYGIIKLSMLGTAAASISSEFQGLLRGSVVMQPAKFQVSNYNLHPPVAIALDEPLLSTATFKAALIELETNTEITSAFQAGEERKIPAGSKLIYFTGLKFNKMGPIKQDLQKRELKPCHELIFCVEFSCGSTIWRTEQFKIVSSCSQLPSDCKELRPTKKRLQTPIVEIKHSSSKSSAMPNPRIQTDPNVQNIREQLEIAIENGDAETAARCARQLAMLRASFRR